VKLHQRCACGAEITIEVPDSLSMTMASQRDVLGYERREAHKAITKWEREHKGHGTAALPSTGPQEDA
jgi:hypothetical protein